MIKFIKLKKSPVQKQISTLGYYTGPKTFGYKSPAVTRARKAAKEKLKKLEKNKEANEQGEISQKSGSTIEASQLKANEGVLDKTKKDYLNPSYFSVNLILSKLVDLHLERDRLNNIILTTIRESRLAGFNSWMKTLFVLFFLFVLFVLFVLFIIIIIIY